MIKCSRGTRTDAKDCKNKRQKVLLLSEKGRKLEQTTRGFEECKEQLIIHEAEATQKIE
jgi:hypothetical protein